MNALTEVNRLINLGVEIETNMPELRQISFTVENLTENDLVKISNEYSTLTVPPNSQTNRWRTTILSGKVKILCISSMASKR